ncbi:hypothetical protein [Mesorhizobium sp.]|uniref:hypothetical protein n=1 Tax=Mesorhizobium sp. TaxID=1871066 RepID=UPI00257A6010|nr:hypothetical protein [Mesorhizobium sp.]
MTTTTATKPSDPAQHKETTLDQWWAAAANREATLSNAIEAADVAPHWSSFPKHGYRDIRLGCEGWGTEHEIIRTRHRIGDCRSCCRR